MMNLNDIKKGDWVSYVVPGTSNDISTGIVVDFASNRTEDFVVVVDSKSKKRINIISHNISEPVREHSMKKPINSSRNPKMQMLENKLRKMVREEMLKEENVQYPEVQQNVETAIQALNKAISMLLSYKTPEANAVRRPISDLRDKLEYVALDLKKHNS